MHLRISANILASAFGGRSRGYNGGFRFAYWLSFGLWAFFEKTRKGKVPVSESKQPVKAASGNFLES